MLSRGELIKLYEELKLKLTKIGRPCIGIKARLEQLQSQK